MGRSAEECRLVLEAAPNMIWKSGIDARCDYFNGTWLEFRGRTLEEELGDGWTEGLHPDDHELCLRTYLGAFRQRKPFNMRYRLRRHDGEYRWIQDTGVPLCGSDGEFAGYVGSCVDITAMVEAEKTRDISLRDALTGAFNRYYFERLLGYEFEKAYRYDTGLSLIMLDIDNLKVINDLYGNRAGDDALRSIAKSVHQLVRKTDRVARYGRDEFLVMLPMT